MDRDRRNNLKRVVNRCRKILEKDIELCLLAYGIKSDGEMLKLALSEEKLVHQGKLEEAIDKEISGGLDRPKAVKRYIRHVGFTYLNRIAALRAMEVRELIKETIIRREKFGGRSHRERDISETNSLLSPDELLTTSLVKAFEAVGNEINVLFDMNNEYSLLVPNARALRELIQLLTVEVTEDDWKQDDIIGWIYQYYNEEARKEFKKSKRKPTADDIPVINQFYTPHWVVRVLTDNTLGRLWLEQQGRCSILIEKEDMKEVAERRAGIPDVKDEPEKFKDWLRNPQGETVDTFCSYFVPLMNEPPEREKKRAREIRVLDPACGSGHFLIYAFDVLYKIYIEDEPETPKDEIPNLILENNLFGIDIDLRAVQLAALSLYLKAKSYKPDLKIRKMNLVCADSHIADGKKRRAFLQRFNHDPALQEIFAKLFEDLNNTNELGSLLKVREPFEKLFAKRKKEKIQAKFVVDEGLGQAVLSEKGATVPQKRLGLKEVIEDVMEIPKEITIENMLAELHRFERECMGQQDMGSLLFAMETEKSVGLLSLLSQKYDVVLMNPPYGDFCYIAKKYAELHYQKSKNNLYSTFMEIAIDALNNYGFLGSITERMFLVQRNFENFRKAIILGEARSLIYLDFWYDVLDGAMNRTVGSVLMKEKTQKDFRDVQFVNLKQSQEKQTAIENVIKDISSSNNNEILRIVEDSVFKDIPGSPFLYWAPINLLRKFKENSLISEELGIGKQGLATGSDQQFVRFFWEIRYDKWYQRWKMFAKGGTFSPFYRNNCFIVDWLNNGKEIKELKDSNGKLRSRPQNEAYYFRQGISWDDISDTFNAQYLSPRHIFTPVSYGFFVKNRDKIWYTLSLFNSKTFGFIVSLLMDGHHWTIGCVGKVPHKFPDENKINFMGNWGKEIHDILCEYDTGNEISTIFIKPWILQVIYGWVSNEEPITGSPLAEQFRWEDWHSLKEMRNITCTQDMLLRKIAELGIKRKKHVDKRVQELQDLIDEEVYRIYEISEEDRKQIERELAQRRGEAISAEDKESDKRYDESVSEEGEQKDLEAQIKDHVLRLISFYVKQSLEEREDGIIPLDPMFGDNLHAGVRQKIARDFGEINLDRIEIEFGEIVGRSLVDWLAKDYFDYHCTMYKRRPIFWQLVSDRIGRSRRGQAAFSCFLHYHKLIRNTIPKVQAFYLSHVKNRAAREKDRVLRELEKARIDGSRTIIKRRAKDYEQAVNAAEELETFESALNTLHNERMDKIELPKNPKWVQEKIKEVRDDGWKPVIDYGVRVNIEPLKELRIVPPSADKVK